MSTSTTKVWQPRAKITPPLRSFGLDLRERLTAAEKALSDGRNSRTVDVYMRAIRAFLDFDPEVKTQMTRDRFYIDGEQFKRYSVYLKEKGACIHSKLRHLLNALSVAFPHQFDKDALRELCRQHKFVPKHARKEVITLPIGSLSEPEWTFVAFIEDEYGYHRRDNYLRFMGHLHRFRPEIMTIDYRKRFLQSTFQPVLTTWLASVSNASSLQGFHLVGDALNAWLKNTSGDWMKLAIRARVKALAPHTKRSTARNKPRIASRRGKGGTSRTFKILTDMRHPPLLNLMDTLAPTHRSPIQPSRPFRAIRETSRGLLDRDVLSLINARIQRGIGSPDDRAEEIFALPSLMALTEFLDHGELDARTKGRVLGRIRWLRRRVYPHDDDHGSLYLSVMGRDYFRSRRPQRRNVSHIDYSDLTERLRALLREVECGLQAKIGGHSLRYVEWRDLLIVGLMLATGIRLKNAHGLKSHWFQLGPAPCLSIPGSEHKNGRPFTRALPDWLVTSLRAYAPHLGDRALPDTRVWRSRDKAPLSRSAVERSVPKTSLCLLGEPLQPHDYRRLHCVFVQDSDAIDQTKAHLNTGHSRLSTLYAYYPSRTVPGYLDIVLTPYRARKPDADSPESGPYQA